MPRYWIIAPVESKPPELFDKVWQFDIANNLISISWKELGDVSKMSREELSEAVASTYVDKPPATKALYTNMIWAFYHEISPGDFIIARRGRKTLAGVGKVSRSAFYAPGKSPVHGHPNFLEVSWQEQPRDKVFPDVVFPMHTLSEFSDEQFRSFLESSGAQSVSSEVPEALEDPNAFVLEKYLEDFIVSNFHTIFKGELKIYEDAEGNDGQQYSTDIGPIDILSVEPKSKSFVVIELKKGRPSDQVIGQILRYMGWVKQNLCTSGQVVKGLIICRNPDPKLSYALEMTNNIDVRYYSVSFKLREAP
ncbi:MAG TPA: endonuclease NucS domain-containing protein [Anaerolineales bacterium]|nr:endonuclease NucS domain-containing protein [Anaerolineales bacterium]